jgi:4,4'-diaponeurosporenoate glycosyltransferase
MELTTALMFCVAGSTVLAARLAATHRAEPAGPLPAASPGTLDVSVIVPARDERHNLDRLLTSLNALSPAPREIIVVDDHSSDGSAELAASYGARVVRPEPLPHGLVGKSWACAAGARVAQGRALLFTDADTEHAPDSLARALSVLAQPGVGLVSVAPTHRLVQLWEQLQGAFHLLLLIATRAGAQSLSRDTRRRFAIGQYLLMRRDVYDLVGGHLSVADQLSEDLALAQRVAAFGSEVRVVFARDLYRVRMYPEGLAAFLAGWRRSFRDGMGRAGLLGGLELTLVITYLLRLPLWCLDALASGAYGVAAFFACAYCTTAWLISREQRHYGAFHGASALLYPLPVLAFVVVSTLSLGDALLGRPVVWRGRRIEQGRPAG